MDIEKLVESINNLTSETKVQNEKFDKVIKAYQEKVDKGKVVDPPENVDPEETKEKEKGDVKPARKIEFEPETRGEIRPIQKIIETPPDRLSDAEKEIQEFNDKVLILSTMLKIHPRSLKTWQEFESSRSALKKAMDSATSGEGAEWIPTGFSAALIEKLRLARKVAALHTRITMPTDPYKVPVEGGDVTPYLVTEQTGDTGQTKIPVSTPGTANYEISSKGIAGRVLTSHYLEEDSIIPIIPFIKDKLVKALVDGEENATINGDTTATHMDSDVTAANDVRKAWNGYRDVVQSAAKEDLSTFSTANLRKIRKDMGKYGVNPADLAWIAGMSVYNQMLGLSEVITLDKYGPSATILTGELAKFDGIPVIVSEYVRQNLNASGVYDGTTTTKTIVLLVYRPGFHYGDRRLVTLRLLTELYAESEQDCLIATRREVLWTPWTVANEYIVGLGYNITT